MEVARRVNSHEYFRTDGSGDGDLSKEELCDVPYSLAPQRKETITMISFSPEGGQSDELDSLFHSPLGQLSAFSGAGNRAVSELGSRRTDQGCRRDGIYTPRARFFRTGEQR